MSAKLLLLIFISLSLLHCSSLSTTQENKTVELERFQFTQQHMGSPFRIVMYAKDESIASTAADSAFRRVTELNQIMSDYVADSELNRLSATAGSGQSIQVSEPLFEVISIAQKVANQSNEAFDITVAPLVSLWRETRNETSPVLPDETTIKAAAEAVGHRFIHLDKENRTVRLEKEGMRLDLGGIAKGYAAEKVKNVLTHFDIYAVLIDAGGDMVIGEAPPKRAGWTVAVNRHSAMGDPDPFVLTLTNAALSTSGDLFQFVEIDGVRYSHIVDPQTGLGITQRITVTVIGENGTLTDAYSTALSVMPRAEAMHLINRLEGYHAFIEINDEGTIRQYESDGFEELR